MQDYDLIVVGGGVNGTAVAWTARFIHPGDTRPPRILTVTRQTHLSGPPTTRPWPGGCRVISVREPWLDTSGPVRQILIAIFGWVAEQERTRLIVRTKAGLDRSRRQGKRLGRPPASPVLLHAARDLVTAGVSVAAAARRKGVARSTLQRFLAGCS